jgi:hypothetical protein
VPATAPSVAVHLWFETRLAEPQLARYFGRWLVFRCIWDEGRNVEFCERVAPNSLSTVYHPCSANVCSPFSHHRSIKSSSIGPRSRPYISTTAIIIIVYVRHFDAIKREQRSVVTMTPAVEYIRQLFKSAAVRCHAGPGNCAWFLDSSQTNESKRSKKGRRKLL